MRVKLPYGRDELDFEIDERRVNGIIAPAEVSASARPQLEVEEALDHPIEGPTIEALNPKGRTVAIAVDDITRVTPTSILLPPILRRLKKAGAKVGDIEIIVALGTHRPMTDGEMKDKYGAEVVEEYRFLNHAFDDEASLQYLGKIGGDVPVWINQEYLKADLRIATGNLVPHCNAGWAGGAKTLLPGLAGEETVGQMHVRSALATPNALGTEDNPTRQLIEAFAERVGLHLIVNTALTRDGEIVKVFAGHFKRAHRKGVEFAKGIYAVPAPAGLANITIASSYPADIDYWQGSKALYAADLVTNPGGTIILVTPCPEGISPTHPKLAEYLQRNVKELKAMAEQRDAEDLVALGAALEMVNLSTKYGVTIISGGISEKDLPQATFGKVDDIQGTVDAVAHGYGPETTLNVLTNGGEIYPLLK